MKTTAVLILALFPVLLGVGPAVAAPKGADQLGEELAALTDAINAQLKLLALYEDMGKADDVAATKKTLLDLLDKQREAGARLRELLGGKPAAEPSDEPFVGGRTSRIPPPDAKPLPPAGSVRDVIDRGLAWLAAHQHADGHWDCDGWMKPAGLGAGAGAGHAPFDAGVTGLALLAFLGDGQTHKNGNHKATVKAGLRYLKQLQDPEGCFGLRTSQRFVYHHAICTLAMIEAYALTESPVFKRSAQLATDFIHKAQNPYLAWRYGVRPQDNDTSVTGWMVLALHAAKRANLRVSPEAFAGAMAWIDKATEPEYGRVGYTARGTGPARPQDVMDRYPADKSESLTAVGLVTRVHCGHGKGELYEKGIALCLKRLPLWDEDAGTTDMYYWFWGTMALRQSGGAAWKAWRPAMAAALTANQRQAGPLAGSFDPIGPWGRNGGRIYSTAILTLTAEMASSAAAVKGAGK
ncbi:MAG: prenyltransferase/squalene oxidase repeat-containing protein [Planctomycetota bacterium]